MRYAFLLGLVLSAIVLWYRGLYSGPWLEATYTAAFVIGATIILYFALKILAGAANFFFKILVIAGILFACYYGGKKAITVVEQENSQIEAPSTK